MQEEKQKFMKISLVAAVSQNGVIGSDNKIPWHISADFKHFKEITMNHHILMGKNTYESIGKVLPGRTNIILSSDKNFKVDEGFVFDSIEKAIAFAKQNGETELMIIGGGSIYKMFYPIADKIYLTKVLNDFEGNIRFPEIEMDKWKIESSEKHLNEEIPFEFLKLVKNT